MVHKYSTEIPVARYLNRGLSNIKSIKFSNQGIMKSVRSIKNNLGEMLETLSPLKIGLEKICIVFNSPQE
jgi:hypothetical protein